MNDLKNVRMTISKNIKKYRKKAKLSQTELARILEISPSSVSNWEQGLNSIDIDTLFRVCKILNVSIDRMATDGEEVPADSFLVETETPQSALIEKVENMSDDQAKALLDFVVRMESYAQKYFEKKEKGRKKSDF